MEGEKAVRISEDIYKEINMLKAKISMKKGKNLSWDEFFEQLIRSERRKKSLTSWLYTIGIFTVITLILMPFGAPLIPLYLAIGFVIACFSAYVLTPWTLKGIKSFDDAPPEIPNFIEELSKKAMLKKTPKLMIAETDEINAMTYKSIKGDRICVTRGLVDAYLSKKIEEGELKAILGHEIGHIVNKDCLKWAFVYSWISIFNMVGTLFIAIGSAIGGIGAVIGGVSRDKSMGWAMVFFGWILIISGIIQKAIAKIASILAFHLSRKQEYSADVFSAALSSPEDASSALQKIHSLNNELVAKEIAALPYADRWQIQPCNPSWIDRLFDTHPPIDKRVEELRRISEFL